MSGIELIKPIQNMKHHVQILNPKGKETIIMSHGMFGNLSQFYLTLAPFLSNEYRVIMYDIKCHGKSERHDGGFDLTTLSYDLLSILNDHNIDKCHLLGFSYGALIVLKFATLFEERVAKIVAMEVPPRHTYELKKRGGYNYDDFMWFASTLQPSVRANFLRSKRQIQNSYKMYEYIYNETSYVEDMENEKEFDVDFYEKLDMEVQLFFGESSICIPELKRIERWIRHVTVSMEPGDHGFFMHRPNETSQKVVKFLKRVKL